MFVICREVLRTNYVRIYLTPAQAVRHSEQIFFKNLITLSVLIKEYDSILSNFKIFCFFPVSYFQVSFGNSLLGFL